METNFNKNNLNQELKIDSIIYINNKVNNIENKTETNNQKTKHIRKNSLIENNETAKWTHDVFMKNMDKYAYLRGMTVFSFTAFFLGNSLNIFLWMYIILTIYLLIYRLIRFWTKRNLLYFFEFCYFGNVLFLWFLLDKCNNEDLFLITFIFNTGIITSSVIVFNNQTQFNSTDHLTSAWIHTLPMISSWSIRWRHLIYSESLLRNLSFDFKFYGDLKFNITPLLLKLLCYPVMFWCSWALFYLIVMGILLRKFNNNSKYSSGLTDFKHFMKNSNFLGDPNNYTILKYLFKHMGFLVLSLPMPILCFYNHVFNTTYILVIVVFLGWNTGRNNLKNEENAINE